MWRDSNGVYIERVDLTTGRVDHWAMGFLERRANMGEYLTQKATWGKAWTYGNGNLGFAQGGDSANQRNPGVQITVTNPTGYRPSFQVVALLDKVPESYNTDAASNARRTPPPVSDLALEKVTVSKNDGRTYPGFDKRQMQSGRTYWAINVKNLGPDNSPGAIVTDVVPKAFEDVRLEAEYGRQKDGYDTLIQLSPNDRSLRADGLFGTGPTDFQYILGPTMPGDEVWMYLSASLKRKQQCAANTAAVANNDLDPNPGNNSDESGCPRPLSCTRSSPGSRATVRGLHRLPTAALPSTTE
ncbi:hypothetical protein JKI95_08320 [Corynebacterium aquatimens]|uniref:DUF11 domain-containing protein n=1 Tax=Corynebacterium aquatimens TaxID=1190508 RepID=UPI00254137A7|nr:DUF11 domain-containing protein [Corynebacterium aquatimens]QYH19214.1 hypothetical protein JKI95_08320 [Corynebacterium aquatimens]